MATKVQTIVTPPATTQFVPLTGVEDPRIVKFVQDFQRAGYGLVQSNYDYYKGPAVRIAPTLLAEARKITTVPISTAVDADGTPVVFPVITLRE